MIADITIVFTCQNIPWLILGSYAVTVIGPNVFFQARSIMLNRVMASDELTLYKYELADEVLKSSRDTEGLK